jgi:ATP-dependent RNA helicase RhlE
MTFRDLNLSNPLLNALDDLGFTQPTPIQEKTFTAMLAGKDVLGIAQTGTGKTLAYLLPCLRQWKFTKDKNPTILILVPTRELVAQIVSEVEKLSKYTNVVVGGAYGGTNINTQALMIANGLDVLVGTPGRLRDLALNGALKLKAVKKLVIDEVDEMLDLGFKPQLTALFDLLPEKRQNIMFSATMTEPVEALIDTYFNYPEKIEAAPTGTPLENIEQKTMAVPNFNSKLNLLVDILETDKTITKGVIFIGTKRLADNLFDHLDARFPDEIGIIHSDKAQNARFNTVLSFQTGLRRLLIATDIIARGIDLSDVTHVINFDTPDDPQKYMHRIGRTGRAEKKGISITFVANYETEFLQAIESLMNYEIPKLPLPENLLLSDILIEEEQPKIQMKTIQVKVAKKDESNAAFHDKSDKRKKVNHKIRRKEAMQIKYGKPQTRGDKFKKKR